MTGKNRTLTAGPGTMTVIGTQSQTLGLLAAVTLAVLTWVGANIFIPMEPVPVTMQTLFVLLAGSVVASRYGALSQVLYVGAGALGLPIFAGGLAGWGILAGPTGGYLLSFLVAPWVVSRIISRSHTLVGQTLAFIAGTLVIFGFGVGHLALFYTHDVAAALQLGLLPFIPGAILKIAAALSIHRSCTALVRHYAPSRDA